MAQKSDCVFCKIIRSEIPAQKVYEDDFVFGFKDIAPVAPIHCLFVPKNHMDSLVHLEDLNLMEKLYKALLLVAEKEGLTKTGFRSVINTGTEGGQTVFHLHLHLIGGRQLSPRMS